MSVAGCPFPPGQSGQGGPVTPDGGVAAPQAAWIVVAAGVCAALHVGKLAPAIAVLQRDLGLTLVEAGFLLGLVQGAGMTIGLLVGAWCDGLGARRSLVLGLLLQAAASASGALVSGVWPMLVLRAIEGLGFLMVVLPAPGLLRVLTPPERLRGMLGTWGAFMPVAIALALLAGPPVIESAGWRAWWAALAGVSVAMALTLRLTVPATGVSASRAPGPKGAAHAPAPGGLHTLGRRVATTLRAPGPWFVALTFSVYSSQWLAVVGFLPTIVAQAGLDPLLVGGVAAGVAAANVLGNAASGHLMQRGVAPPVLLATGFATMAVGAWLGFAPLLEPGSGWRLIALVLFSAVGGLIPGTLFALAVQVAPDERVVSSTVGWMQQWSAAGQVLGPPAVAWVASAAGGWERTWLATGACCALGLVLAAALAHWQQPRRAPR